MRADPETSSAGTVAGAPPILGSGSEPLLSDFLQRYADRDTSAARWLIGRPRATREAVRALLALPALRGTVSDSLEGRAVRREFARFTSRRWLLGLATVLEIPGDPAAYREGSSKQTLRRKTRAAQQAGVTWHAVDDPDERARLLLLANEHERSNTRERYRQASPQNDDLVGYRLWLVACDGDGTPILLSVTPYDGRWASLRYFRTLVPNDVASIARYWMTDVLVQHLSARGVQYLIDAAVPHWLPNGLRHFQRMLGFRLVRLRLIAARPTR